MITNFLMLGRKHVYCTTNTMNTNAATSNANYHPFSQLNIVQFEPNSEHRRKIPKKINYNQVNFLACRRFMRIFSSKNQVVRSLWV